MESERSPTCSVPFAAAGGQPDLAMQDFQGQSIKSLILFADLIGCSEISDEASIKEYAGVLHEFSRAARDAYRISGMQWWGDYIQRERERRQRVIETKLGGDEVSIFLHPDVLEEECGRVAGLSVYEIGLRRLLMFAFALKLNWLFSDYNKKRLEDGRLPRDVGVGIHFGNVFLQRDRLSLEGHPLRYAAEGYAINLTKRIESASRRGTSTKIFISNEVKGLLNHFGRTTRRSILRDLGLARSKGFKEALKGLSTYTDPLYELTILLEDGGDGRGRIDRNFLQLLDLIFTPPDREKIKDIETALQVYPDKWWLHAVAEQAKEVERRGGELAAHALEVGAPMPDSYVEDVSLEAFIDQTLLPGGDMEEERPAEANAQDVKRLVRQGNQLLRTGRAGEALQILRQALAFRPDDPDIHFEMANAYYNLADYAQAVRAYDHVLRHRSEDALIHMSKGMALTKLGEHAQAALAFDRAVEQNPEDEFAVYSRGLARFHVGEYESAAADFDRTLELNPDYTKASVYKARTFAHLNQNNRALAECDKMLRKNPDLLDAHLIRAEALTALGKFRNAAISYADAMAIDPENPRVHAGLAATLSKAGQTRKALAARKKAAELAPDDPEHGLNLVLAHLVLMDFSAALETLARLPGGSDGEEPPDGNVGRGESVRVFLEAMARLSLERPSARTVERLRDVCRRRPPYTEGFDLEPLERFLEKAEGQADPWFVERWRILADVMTGRLPCGALENLPD